MNRIILKLHTNQVCFNQILSVPVAASNLPEKEINFVKVREVYWTVEQLSFDKSTGKLFVNIIDLFPRNTEGFAGQSPKYPINEIHFANLPEPRELKQCLEYYKKDMSRVDKAREEALSDLMRDADNVQKPGKTNLLFRTYPDSDKTDLSFNVNFKDAAIKLGYIVFERNVPSLRQLARFKVENDFLLPEFELIKSYLIKALGTKKFDVQATVFIEKGEITATKARSDTISRINEGLIESIKNERTLRLATTSFKGNIDKQLFTSEEIFDIPFEEGEKGNVFDQSEEEILRLILEKAKVRNRKQLEYLSGLEQARGTRLKFTLHPFFGFVFAVEGERMVHFIWELLNSHATYIWSLDKEKDEMKRQYRRVEDAINLVRNSGRDNYKRAYHDSHIDQDLVFKIIKHEDVNSPFVEGFVKWRHRLNELLI